MSKDLNLMNSIPSGGIWFSGETFARFVAHAVATQKQLSYIPYLYMGIYGISKDNDFFVKEAVNRNIYNDIPTNLAEICTEVLIVKISDNSYFFVPLCWPEIAFEVGFMANIKSIGKSVEIKNPHAKYPALE